MPKHIDMKPAKIPIYGRAPLLKPIKRSDLSQSIRYYNYLLMIEHYHKSNSQPHANRVLKQIQQPLPIVHNNNKEHLRNISWSYLMPHWIGGIFTRQKVGNQMLSNTA